MEKGVLESIEFEAFLPIKKTFKLFCTNIIIKKQGNGTITQQMMEAVCRASWSNFLQTTQQWPVDNFYQIKQKLRDAGTGLIKQSNVEAIVHNMTNKQD